MDSRLSDHGNDIRQELSQVAPSTQSFPRRRASITLKKLKQTWRPRMAHKPSTYILSNKKNGTLYIGVTSNLAQRIWQHKSKVCQGFSNKYDLDMLIFYELHVDIKEAILREKQLKKWRRQWKINLINEQNPNWVDLWESILG